MIVLRVNATGREKHLGIECCWLGPRSAEVKARVLRKWRP